MMDFQLTLPRSCGARRRTSRTSRSSRGFRQELPPLHVPRLRPALPAARGGLKNLGLERGDRVATLAWNHYQHMECYLGIPCGGFVHTPRSTSGCIRRSRVHRDARRRQRSSSTELLPLLDQFKDDTPIEHVLVVEDSYEELLASDPDEETPSSTRDRGRRHVLHERHHGHAKGVVYRTARRSSTRSASPRRRSAIRCRRRTRSCRSSDVPRERVGLPVPRDDDGREHRLPGTRTSTARACSTRSSRRR